MVYSGVPICRGGTLEEDELWCTRTLVDALMEDAVLLRTKFNPVCSANFLDIFIFFFYLFSLRLQMYEIYFDYGGKITKKDGQRI